MNTPPIIAWFVAMACSQLWHSSTSLLQGSLQAVGSVPPKYCLVVVETLFQEGSTQ